MSDKAWELPDEAEVLERIKPYHVWIEHGLRQEIRYIVGGYRIYARPAELEIYEHGFEWKLSVRGPETETPDFHYLDEPEPSLFDVLDYWAGMAWFLQHLACEMAEIVKEAGGEA